MDIKTKLQDEKLFAERNSLFFKNLNEKGIYTVEDYINAEAEKISSNSSKRKMHRAYQRVLKHKYLGEPLVVDALLEKEYCFGDTRTTVAQIRADYAMLGLRDYGISLYIELDKKFKMIDLIIDIFNDDGIPFDSLMQFYVEYYNEKVKNDAVQNKIVENDKEYLDSLKNELISLLNQKNELDKKISQLIEQINVLGEGKAVNGK